MKEIERAERKRAKEKRENERERMKERERKERVVVYLREDNFIIANKVVIIIKKKLQSKLQGPSITREVHR